jgi:hypothetical protein
LGSGQGGAEHETVYASPATCLVISSEGIISVQPMNNRELFGVLKGKVEGLIGEISPKLAAAA